MKHQDKMMGVYRLYRLGRMGMSSGYDKTIKVLEREYVVIPNNYAEDVNAFSETNGLFYEKLVQETELYYDKKPFKNEPEYTAFEEVVESTKEDFTTTMQTEYAVEPKKVVDTIEKIVNKPKAINKLAKEDIKETLGELREKYTALAEKNPLPMWGKVQLTKEIAKLKK